MTGRHAARAVGLNRTVPTLWRRALPTLFHPRDDNPEIGIDGLPIELPP
ncbi:hypothetical protein ABZ345_45615 [Lentzea sp. NPDC005914]